MVNHKASANLGTRVDFDSGPEFGPVANQAGQEEPIGIPQLVRDSVSPNRVNARGRKKQFKAAAGGRVSVQSVADIFGDSLEHLLRLAANLPGAGKFG